MNEMTIQELIDHLSSLGDLDRPVRLFDHNTGRPATIVKVENTTQYSNVDQDFDESVGGVFYENLE